MDKIRELKAKAMPYGTFETRATAEVNDREIKGYLAIWGEKDMHGTIFLKGCCAKSLQERGVDSDANYKITLLWQHDLDEPIGRFLELKEDDKGLYFRAEIDDFELGNRVLKQIKSGTLNQFSIGFRYIWDKVEWDGDKEAYIIKEIDLIEGSVVTIGSNSSTHAIRSIEDFDNKKAEIKEDLELLLKEIPRKKQIELRKILSDYISLIDEKPLPNTLESRAEKKIDFKLLNLKN